MTSPFGFMSQIFVQVIRRNYCLSLTVEKLFEVIKLAENWTFEVKRGFRGFWTPKQNSVKTLAQKALLWVKFLCVKLRPQMGETYADVNFPNTPQLFRMAITDHTAGSI